MKLGITTIQRDRGPWIKEWVAFHYLVGFRKFYIYTHKCQDDTIKIVEQLKNHFDIKSFIVPPELDRAQYHSYNQAYHSFGHEVDYMAFIDGDEFLFPTSEFKIEKVLEEYSDKKLSAIAAYWACFGSSGHIEEPAGLIIENYRYRHNLNWAANKHVKSIVRGGLGSLIKSVIDPHVFYTPEGTFDENMRLIESGFSIYDPTHEKLRINHYVTQSRSYFLKFKQRSGTPMDMTTTPIFRTEDWWIENDVNDVYDTSVEKYIDSLKDILNSI